MRAPPRYAALKTFRFFQKPSKSIPASCRRRIKSNLYEISGAGRENGKIQDIDRDFFEHLANAAILQYNTDEKIESPLTGLPALLPQRMMAVYGVRFYQE